jgi:hypothetical protein
MAQSNVMESVLNEIAASVEKELTQAVPESSRAASAHLTGLEIMGFMALKVVLPIACGLVSRSLYELYKNLQTKKKAAEAKAAVLAKQDISADPVDVTTMQQDLSAMLVREGIPESRASEIVRGAITQLKTRIAGPKPSEQTQ